METITKPILKKDVEVMFETFGLTPIRNKTENQKANQLLGIAMRMKRSPAVNAWVDLLISKIEAYEDKHCKWVNTSTPADFIRTAMTEMQLRQCDLVDCIAQPNLSAFLRGERELSKTSARKLSKRLKIPLEVLLG